MKISEIKKLTLHEFAERYPFLQYRGWDTDKMEYYKVLHTYPPCFCLVPGKELEM